MTRILPQILDFLNNQKILRKIYIKLLFEITEIFKKSYTTVVRFFTNDSSMCNFFVLMQDVLNKYVLGAYKYYFIIFFNKSLKIRF